MSTTTPRIIPHCSFLFLLTFLAGCGSQEFQFNPYQGTDGIQLEFLPQAPPEHLYTNTLGEPVEIAITVHNRGAYDAPTAYLTLATQQDYVTLEHWDLPTEQVDILGANQQRIAFPLKGKSLENPFGEEQTFRAFATARLDPQLETIETELLATVCAPYRTEAHAMVCIDTDPNDLHNRKKICRPDSLSFQGQGAPIAITAIHTEILPSGPDFVRPRFTITIEDLGGGTALNVADASTACSSAAIDPKSFDALSLQDVVLSQYSLRRGHFECRPLPIILQDGILEIVCTLKPGLIRVTQDTFTTDLS